MRTRKMAGAIPQEGRTRNKCCWGSEPRMPLHFSAAGPRTQGNQSAWQAMGDDRALQASGMPFAALSIYGTTAAWSAEGEVHA